MQALGLIRTGQWVVTAKKRFFIDVKIRPAGDVPLPAQL